MADGNQCNLCADPSRLRGDSEVASVRSNVRAFRDEKFVVWRCARCRSIHARDEVDLPHYYAMYPFHKQKFNWILRIVYRNVLRRLKRAGLKRSHRILDYGCGSGHLIHFLKSKGYAHAAGYDAFGGSFSDPAVLDETYDFVHSQDVVEHVDDPRALLRTFASLAKPGGTIVIGTPNADAIDLTRPEDFVHPLHQPYHTHIFSKGALLAATGALGWTLDRYYATQYTNTLVPGLNMRFALYYGKCFDDTLDLAFDGVRVNRRLLSPRSLVYALFGYFFCPETDVMAVFRTADPHSTFS
ncbi:MAG: class I SAM-dependent methyltransferase [Promethearchaeota archaeon]|jgi:SAM-dependent methyltransferase